MKWSVTVDDPSTWTRPWTFAMPLTAQRRRADDAVRVPRRELRPEEHPERRARRRTGRRGGSGAPADPSALPTNDNRQRQNAETSERARNRSLEFCDLCVLRSFWTSRKSAASAPAPVRPGARRARAGRGGIPRARCRGSSRRGGVPRSPSNRVISCSRCSSPAGAELLLAVGVRARQHLDERPSSVFARRLDAAARIPS